MFMMNLVARIYVRYMTRKCMDIYDRSHGYSDNLSPVD